MKNILRKKKVWNHRLPPQKSIWLRRSWFLSVGIGRAFCISMSLPKIRCRIQRSTVLKSTDYWYESMKSFRGWPIGWMLSSIRTTSELTSVNRAKWSWCRLVCSATFLIVTWFWSCRLPLILTPSKFYWYEELNVRQDSKTYCELFVFISFVHSLLQVKDLKGLKGWI